MFCKTIRSILIIAMMVTVSVCTITVQLVYATVDSFDDLQNSKSVIIEKTKITEENSDAVVKLTKAKIDLKHDIHSFAVSEDRIIIVVEESILNDHWTLAIFDKKGNLLNTFKLYAKLRTCGILMHGDNIVLFPDGTIQYATELTQEGEFVCFYKVTEHPDGLEDIMYDAIFDSSRKQGSDIYYMSGNGKTECSFDANAPYLVKRDRNGNIRILYDNFKNHRRNMIMFKLLFGGIALFIIIVFYLIFKKEGYIKDFRANFQKAEHIVVGSEEGVYVYKDDKEQDETIERYRKDD